MAGLAGPSWSSEAILLPSRDEALRAPVRAFPGWYLRLECGVCGQVRYLSQRHLVHAGKGDQLVRDFVARLQHEDCGGRPKRVELVTRVPGIARSGRSIVLAGPWERAER
jgi:hypothetical protein